MTRLDTSEHAGAGFSTPDDTSEGLSVVEITKIFGKRQVLHGISLRVLPGEIIGLFGRDGAGKTVTFYSIIGLIRPNSGRIALNGKDITHLPFYRRAILGLGYLPQEPSIFRGLTVEQNILATLEMVETDPVAVSRRLDELLKALQIDHLRNVSAKSLSGGERRRCEIARALALEPSIMLLDEPFAGIDPLTIGNIKSLVREFKKRNIGVLISDQDVPDMLELIDRAYVIHEGAILFEGTPAKMLENVDVRQLYLGSGFAL
ncbi:MAG: LPS export ABC transporter ATP-binding protein [Parasphingopyxis sp.]|uniref:LPS export ABC transporter ATP-binding protein n=1 Tax=Parasphingopyxis sp. TaxID=1920299 RepID=UPI003F9EF3C6